MCHEKLRHMKNTLICAVETQLCNLDTVNTKELGEAIDMIKDLEEAIYYCTVTEAMNNPAQEEWEMKKGDHTEKYDRMYYGGKRYPMMYANPEEEMNGHSVHDGNAYKNRRMYMESKEKHQDKAVQLHELEKYMQELSQDITDMIMDASVEEKQYLEKKITALASKIGQMK